MQTDITALCSCSFILSSFDRCGITIEHFGWDRKNKTVPWRDVVRLNLGPGLRRNLSRNAMSSGWDTHALSQSARPAYFECLGRLCDTQNSVARILGPIAA